MKENIYRSIATALIVIYFSYTAGHYSYYYFSSAKHQNREVDVVVDLVVSMWSQRDHIDTMCRCEHAVVTARLMS